MQELEYRFNIASASDTLFLWNFLLEHGSLEPLIPYVDGFFSILIFNKKTLDVTLYRDKFGQKPLYYSRTDDTFIASSGFFPIQFLKNSLNHHFNHNKAAITSFLCTGICLDDQTAIEEINALRPGHAYNFTLCRTSSSCPFIQNFPSIDPTLSNLDYFLDASTQKLIPNEVNYALLLSEGIDSSLIASYLPPC